MKRLGAVFAALVARRRLARCRSALAAARRLRREAADLTYRVDEYRQRTVDLENTVEDLRARADAADRENETLRGELAILRARDELWLAWEARERVRLEAETARLAAAKTRALDFPQLEPEDRR